MTSLYKGSIYSPHLNSLCNEVLSTYKDMLLLKQMIIATLYNLTTEKNYRWIFLVVRLYSFAIIIYLICLRIVLN